MYTDSNKLLVELKADITVLREQIRTMNLKMDEIITEAYRNISPRIESAASTLVNQISKSQQENGKLHSQVDSLMEEKDNLQLLVFKYADKVEALQNLIEG